MELLERFALGDREAFETLFREYQREVFGWCMRIVRDRGIAEDLTVEAFWKMHRAHARFDPTRSFGAWARRIATNLALDHLRKNRWETALVGEVADVARENPGMQHETRQHIATAFAGLRSRRPGRLMPMPSKERSLLAAMICWIASTIAAITFCGSSGRGIRH